MNNKGGDIKIMGRISAIIPAAGFSSRMKLFKPLLPMTSSLLIEQPIQTLIEAGIEDIRVIVGHKADLLRPILDRLGVKIIFNHDYQSGMYSSIRAGVETLGGDIEAFFLFPLDYATVDVKTIRILLKEYAEKKAEITYPMYNGRRGHPPLISTKFREDILAGSPEGGLKVLFREKVICFDEIPVEDPGIQIDLDTEADYLAVLRGAIPSFPSNDECLKILEKYCAGDRILLHVKEVARISILVSEYLNSRGMSLYLGLVNSSALLHDIAKGEKDHPRRGREIVTDLGYPEVADVIASHMELPDYKAGNIDEAAVVYLADKMVQGDRVVYLENRLIHEKLRYAEDTALLQRICGRLEKAIHIKRRIEEILGLKLEEILGGTEAIYD